MGSIAMRWPADSMAPVGQTERHSEQASCPARECAQSAGSQRRCSGFSKVARKLAHRKDGVRHRLRVAGIGAQVALALAVRRKERCAPSQVADRVAGRGRAVPRRPEGQRPATARLDLPQRIDGHREAAERAAGAAEPPHCHVEAAVERGLNYLVPAAP